MVDTQGQYLGIKEEIAAAIQEVLDSSMYIGGKFVQRFSLALGTYLGTNHTITCANGTDALQISMMALGLRPGDEVILPSFTYIATAEVIALLGLTPVFVDVDADTFCISPDAIKKAITSKTKAIVPVHLYGHAAPMEAIMEIAAGSALYVIEDNAQAIGCEYRFKDGTLKKTGTIGHIGCTSFYPSKNLGAYGDGGAIFTNDAALAEKLSMIANHGQKTRYYHEMVGCNSRLDAIQAAILSIKLQRLDHYNANRRSAAKHYDQAFAAMEELKIPSIADYSTHVYHQYTLTLGKKNREELIKHLIKKGIPSMIYYPVPCHKQKMFDGLSIKNENLEVTEWLTDKVISLPIHTELVQEQLGYITENVLAFYN